MKIIEKNLFTNMEIEKIPTNILEFASKEAKKYFNEKDFWIWVEEIEEEKIKVSKCKYGASWYIWSYFFNKKWENITNEAVTTF